MSQSLSFVEVNGLSWSRLHLEDKQQESTTTFQAGYAYMQLFLRNVRSGSAKLHMAFCNSYVNAKVNLQQQMDKLKIAKGMTVMLISFFFTFLWSEAPVILLADYFYLIRKCSWCNPHWEEQASSARLSRALFQRSLVSCVLSKHTVNPPPIVIKVVPQTDRNRFIGKGHFFFPVQRNDVLWKAR